MRRLTSFAKVLLFVGLSLIALPALAAVFTISQGGTSLLYPSTGWQAGSILFGNGSSALATSTGLQYSSSLSKLTVTNFQSTTATNTSATSTSFFATTASSSNLFTAIFNGANLTSCNASTGKLTWASGLFGCGTDNTSSSTLLSDSDDFTGNDTFSNTITGSITGNAGSATVLQNARTINGVSFNGSTNITVASTTLLGDNNNFSGGNVFANTTTTNATSTNSFATTASSTNIFGGGLFTCNSANQATNYNGAGRFGCVTISASGGGTPNSKFATTTSLVDLLAIYPNGGINTLLGIGTTTPHWGLQVASSTGLQFVLSDANASANLKHWGFRSVGGFLYIATSSDAYATSTTAVFSLDSNGLLSLTSGLLTNGSSTLQNFTGINSTTTNATTTTLFAIQHTGSMLRIGTTATTTINGTGDLLVVGSTTLQNFTGLKATTTNATTTNFSVTANRILINTGGDQGLIDGSSTPSFNIASTTLDAMGNSFNRASTTLLLKNFPQTITLNGFYCTASTTGTALVAFIHDNGNITETSSCTTGSYTRTFTNNTFTSFEDFNVVASSTRGLVNRITVTAVIKLTSN